MNDVQQVEAIIDRLKNIKPGERTYPIWEDYHQLVKSGLTLEAGLHAIEAATSFPEDIRPYEDVSGGLVGYLSSSRFVQDHGIAAIPRILELYSILQTKSARYRAIQLLIHIPELEGALAVMELVRKYFHTGDIPDGSFPPSIHASHAAIYFPELLDYARLDDPLIRAFQIWKTCLTYCEKGFLQPAQILSRSGLIKAEYLALKAKLMLIQGEADLTRNFDYLGNRDTGGLLLDLMRFFPTDEIKQAILVALEDYQDPVLLCWACVAALWLNLPINGEVMEKVAASDEVHNTLYEKLKEFKRTDLFPQQYCTKAAFAQSDIVKWMTHPNQLGWVPDAIELTHIITEESENEISEWFLFRYRISETVLVWDMDATIWRAAWSGPFPIDSEPGDLTFLSDHEISSDPWDAKTPEEHLFGEAEAYPLKLQVRAV